ncbi:ABC-type transport auxiliary lipoprotein family protein [Porphyrobacter sp. ULC335]|jgi:cholesterol transport system auxiliary component|uniref:ABC-type transport auxiliary lipoprotein family protein n=1 Tax=Porphyrobacter sp. ULC335 TaxID=2854260 RepID=UPI00221EC941|nr:ABC-type transport auxiliary lipoprotein family protein [Porphyrobacter sp. ULC335]UYV15585.1 membrane integrity-associated transporter subunit PqiC [Porphyrobacter sp. ULC335]
MNFSLRLALAAPLLLGLSGCISLGGEPPASLLTLSPETRAPAGPGVAGTERPVVAVLSFDTPAKLDVLRVPVAVSDTELAYLQEAFWVEKPARLFRRLVGETIRARGNAMVIDGDDTATLATVTLRGTLIDMGYDAQTSSAVVRFDAVRIGNDGAVTTRRFEAREDGVAAETRAVGAALNAASNRIAAEVADWVAAG